LFIYNWTIHLADEIAVRSNDLIYPGQEAAAGPLEASLGMLLKTSMMVVIRDCFFCERICYYLS
jgi:hypothetical protein